MNLAKRSTIHPQDATKHIHTFFHLLCHYGELALRGKNRSRFEDRLVSNLMARLRPLGDCAVRKMRGRVLVEFADGHSWESLSGAVSKVMGLSNAHPVWRVEPRLEEIQAIIPSALEGATFGSFAVRCRRGEKDLPFTSRDVSIAVGSQIQQLTGARVDLDHPDYICWIEIMNTEAFVSCDRIEGPAGLPVGISGRVAIMLSGGIDSPVAAWRMMRRGCELVAIHFHSHPFTTAASKEKVVELAHILAQWHGRPLHLAMVPFGELQKKIVAETPQPYRVIMYRRFMMRIANALARNAGATALVTGDALGQVASQTLTNLETVSAVSSMPIIRPLIGMDKDEITRDAKRVGTYELSIEPHHDCCGFFEPKRPVTKSYPGELAKAEAPLDVTVLVAQCVAATQWQELSC